MYLSCPSCATSFSVSGSAIGTSGQMVRCFNCSHTWHQYPLPPQTQSQYIPVQYVSPGPYAASPQAGNFPVPQPPNAPLQQGPVYNPPPVQEHVPEPITTPVPEPVASPPPEAPAVPPPPPEAVVEATEPLATPTPDVVEEDIPSDEQLDEMLGPEDEEAVSTILEENEVEEAESVSIDDLENMEDPEPIVSIASEESNDEEVDIVDPEDIPDPEPFDSPTFDAEPEEEEKKGGGIKKFIVWFMVLLIIIGGAGAGAVYKRVMVVELLPASNIVFELIGLGVSIPGQGLKIKSDDPVREERNGKTVTIIKGVITNVSNSIQRVPEILLLAIDGKDKVVRTQKVKPEKLTLAPGKFVKFTGVFKKLPKTAKRLDITYGSFISDTGDKPRNEKGKTPLGENPPKAVKPDSVKPKENEN